MASKRRLNQPKKPLRSWCSPLATGLSMVAHRAGVRLRARNAENRIDTAIDTENCW
ncbi:hypothetical protein D3C76_946230 [compost metagenome]